MGSFVSTDSGLVCPHCGEAALTQTFFDGTGGSSLEGACHQCGYRIEYIGVDTPGAAGTTNRKDGMIVVENSTDDDYGVQFIPGTLIGTHALRRYCQEKGYARAWFVHVTEIDLTVVAGQPGPAGSFQRSVAEARSRLAQLTLVVAPASN